MTQTGTAKYLIRIKNLVMRTSTKTLPKKQIIEIIILTLLSVHI